jgi:hypothetical protein
VTGTEHGFEPVPGVRISLLRTADDKEITDSVTDQGGSYYLGDIRPGQYYVQVDPETLPPGVIVADKRTMVEIHPTKEPQDIVLGPFLASSDLSAKADGTSR